MTALFIQAEGGLSAWQVWPKVEEPPAGSIRETDSYIFELRDCDDAIDADLFIDSTPAEPLRSRKQNVARWRWVPGFHAGMVEATLKVPGLGSKRFEITTDPDVRKLTRTDFDTMVREILEDTFALFALSAFRKGIARQAASKIPPLARLQFLLSRSDEIVSSVEAISKAPRQHLKGEDVTLAAHKATRATGPEILKSFRSGAIRHELVQPSRLPVALGGRLPAQITLRQRRHSVDTPEHRQIKACLRAWSTWLGTIADVLGRARHPDDGELRTQAATWSAKARLASRRLAEAAGLPFLRTVGDAPPQLLMSSVFRHDPKYRKFYRLWQDMNLGLASVFGEFLQMPLARTYELYELWCFLRLLRAAVDEYGQDGLDLNCLFKGDVSGSVTLAAGAIVVPLGSGNALCFQRRFREYWVEPDGEGSFSRTMVPDVVLAGTGLGGLTRRTIVLDAKYRISSGLNDALTSIHTYRDALVRAVDTGRAEGIVTAAYLLTPHVPALSEFYEGTAVPGRLFHPEYRQHFRFGAVTLRPGMSAQELRESLKTIVADSTARP